MKWTSLLAAAVFCISCSQTEKKFNDNLSAQRCDEALENLPNKDPMIKLTDQSQQAAGTALSYALTGASYSAQVVVTVVGGAVYFVGLCAPMVVAQTLSSTRPPPKPFEDAPYVTCLPSPEMGTSISKWGSGTYKATEPLRCPNLSSLNQSLRAVASCYEARGGRDNLERARKTLESIEGAGEYFRCLSREEQEGLRKQRENLNLQLI